MPPHHRSSPSHGSSRGNLFVEHAVDEQPDGTSGVASPASAPARRRGRGLVVPVEGRASLDPSAASAVARFTWAPGGVSAPMRRAQAHTRRADRHAQRLLTRVAGRRYEPLLSVIGVAALLLVTSLLGLSLRDAAGARDHAEREQRAATVALGHARDRIHALVVQRDRAISAARGARRRQTATAAKLAAARARSRSARSRHGRRRPVR